MKKLKKNKGITLIALVITIIVLLLLAGISISALTGSGIFGKAKEAIEEHKYANALEKVKLAVNGAFDETGNLNDEYLKNNVNNIKGLEERITEITYDLIVKVDGYEFIISSLGDVKLKGTTVADGEVEGSREQIMVDKEEYETLKTAVANIQTALANIYTKTEIDNLIPETSSGSVGQNWQLLKTIQSNTCTTTLPGSVWKWGANNETVENLEQFKFIAIQSYLTGYGTYSSNIVSLSEFKKYNSYTNFLGLLCNSSLWGSVYYINNTTVRFRVLQWHRGSSYSIVWY